MQVTRRQFLDVCRGTAASLGLGGVFLSNLETALANPNAPTVIWLAGAGCTGCSVSFLNRISSTSPTTVGDVLMNTINLAVHPTLMSIAGSAVSALADAAYSKGNYILAVEGGIPTAFGGAPCFAWTDASNQEVTIRDAVVKLASKASQVLSIGSCACWGGISAAGPNLGGVRGVSAVTLKRTLNIPGCPPHPDWIVWAVANLLAGTRIEVDTYGRPVTLFKTTVHEMCPRRDKGEATAYGQDGLCLEELGCFGPKTYANCPTIQWNGGVNWCVDANSLCLGCTEPTFPLSPLRGNHAND